MQIKSRTFLTGGWTSTGSVELQVFFQGGDQIGDGAAGVERADRNTPGQEVGMAPFAIKYLHHYLIVGIDGALAFGRQEA